MKKPFSAKSKAGIPARYQHFEKSYPAVMQAVEALGEATQSAGPLDSKSRALVQLAIAIGGGWAAAVQKYTPRALGGRCSPAAMQQLGVAASITSGLSSTRAATASVGDNLPT